MTEDIMQLQNDEFASTIGATDCYIGSTTMIAVDKKHVDFTHTIALYTDTLEGYLQPGGSLGSEPYHWEATGISFTVPASFYEKIPTQRKLECRLVCATYLWDVQIGQSRECTFLAACREEDCRPDLDGFVTDCNETTVALTGSEHTLVRFFSRASCRAYASGNLGATIVKKQVADREIPATEIVLDGVEEGTFRFQATDSRGYQAECTVQKHFIPYRKLTANGLLRRQAPTSDKVELTLTGQWWKGNFGLKDNALQAVCRVEGREIPLTLTTGEDTYAATATIEGIAYDKATALSVTVQDALMENTLSLTVNPGVPIFDWGEKDFAFHVPVLLSDGSEAVSMQTLQSLLAQMTKGETL